MVKGGKRYPSVNNDGKWFAHEVLSKSETRTRELSTSTGMMLSQVKTSLPQDLNFERYPKRRTEQNTRVYPYSEHDNKHAFADNVCVFTQGVGRRKCAGDRRQHNSHFCLCHDAEGAAEAAGGLRAASRSDVKVKQAAEVGAGARRFPRNHKQKAAQAALAQAGQQFMWFGRHDCEPSKDALQVLAATSSSASRTR
ncbi:testis-expressed protein 36 [Betta splendens]|uniref:Testis-expressed protein 36 n=1 Tax=Betta splendens TaxID=158456 RepID=A0A9W2XA95_BETSP|nr:testis-expressed protein 36 [Betta splendens]